MRFKHKKFLLCLMLPITIHAMEAPSIETAAILDTVTTAVGLNAGASELNPLGFIGATAVKLIMIPRINAIENEVERKETQNFVSSMLTGAATNNIMVILGAPTVVCIATGILMYTQLRQK